MLASGGCTVKLHDFALPYWEYLAIEVDEGDQNPLDDDRFIRDGCLVMLLYIALATVDPCGCSYNFDISACRTALQKVDDWHPEVRSLIQTVLLGFEVAETRATIRALHPGARFFLAAGEREFQAAAVRAVKYFVFGYFRAASQSFFEPPEELWPAHPSDCDFRL